MKWEKHPNVFIRQCVGRFKKKSVDALDVRASKHWQMLVMASTLFSHSLLLVIFFFIAHLNAQPSFLYHFCIDRNGNYTADDAYDVNLVHLLSAISTNDNIDYGFYNFSLGQNFDAVYAIGLCRGDVDAVACRSCLNDSRYLLTHRCPNQREAIGWYDNCMLKYSDRRILGLMETAPSYRLWVIDNVTNVDQYSRDLRTLLDDLKGTAAAGNSQLKYAAGSRAAPDFATIYAAVQCTPDLSELDCSDCLDDAILQLQPCCPTSVRVGSPSCNIRYQQSRFYHSSPNVPPESPPPPPPVSPPPPPSLTSVDEEGKKKNPSRTVIAVVLPIVGGLVVISLICIIVYSRRKKSVETADMKREESLQLDFQTIKDATENFSEENKLGQGGFGAVYKGKLPDGQDIAVKRLAVNSSQGDAEFKNEVLLVAKLQHRNLVTLLGFCLERKERLLVYEFVPNGSLDHFILDPVKRLTLTWENRYEIISGIARGLLYLHQDSQLKIIHRDLKASNVLLDAALRPKISDFGMAKMFAQDQTQGKTSKIAGTYGYMAPEYALGGKFSAKSDVYSFGVMVLEIVTGLSQQRLINQNGETTEHLLSYAWRNWKEGEVTNLVDPVMETCLTNEMIRCIHIGLLCVQENSANRPTMDSVVIMLSSDSLSLAIPSQPAFLLHSNVEPNRSSVKFVRQVDVEASVNEASITDLYPR